MSFLDSFDDPNFLQSMLGDGIPSFGGDQPTLPGGIGADRDSRMPDGVPLPTRDPRIQMPGGGIGSDPDARMAMRPPVPPIQDPMGADPASFGTQNGAPAPQSPVPLPPANYGGGIGSDYARNPTPDQVPLPPQRPPQVDMSARSPVPLPPQAGQPGAPMSLAPTNPGPSAPPIPPGGPMQQPGNGGNAVTDNGLLGKFLGNVMPSGTMDNDRVARMRAGIGAGLSKISGSGRFASFARGAGNSMQGGTAEGDKQEDRKLKALGAAINARKAGDTESYRKNYLDYLNSTLDAKKSGQIGGGGKGAAWNKPAYQRYMDGERLFTLQQKQLYKEIGLEDKTLSEPERAKKIEEYQRRSKELQGTIMQGVGVNPKELADIAKNPPGTAQNPHKVQSESDFKSYVQPGQYYVNPRDGKTYVRKSDGESQSSSPTPQAAPPLPSDPALNGGPSTDHEADDAA